MDELKLLKRCRICKGSLTKLIAFGEQPLANDFEKHRRYPLTLMRCTDCGLLQLKEVVAPEILYDEYRWNAEGDV
jgi:hypothetical protein